ncbi:hypothetical protein LR48_Vigan05g020600 [Vigna angularis]|uniref:BTB domain-containing protein n=1 Tax=Phaseolus angularis TaxID=3914 RepID=A0A0L9UJ72_PHAAN|nr:BTB/POZ domain-containing protein At1g04390 isoform X6 [Vigna angularis]KOM42602.1 hypothetical protein LR48_Vigan05g020600 [Vigna angularis]
MKSGRDKEKENDRCISSHMQTLHRRLIHALNLGTRHFDEKTNRWRWQCANIEVQKNVLRSIGAFLDSLSGDARAARHTVVKESVPDILGALLWILQCKNEALLSMASNVAVKLVSVLPNPLLQSHMLDLVYCLSSLLSSHQVEVAIPCATTLNFVISNLSATNEKEVMEALKETEATLWIVGNIKDFAEGVKKIEYFEEMTLLLSTILWRWPPSRFSVCNDVILMKGLANIHTKTDSSIKLALLKLYTSIALCDSAARRLIEDEEIFPQMFVQAMGKSNPHAIRIEGFRLAQCLLRSQDNCLKVVGLCGDALVEAIICGMTETRVTSKKFGNNHGSLSVEACQLALITRWAEILHQCDLLQDNPQQFSGEVTNITPQFVSKLQEICKSNSFSPGVRWYVSYILTYFGYYGFPTELAKRIGESLNKEEYSDMKLVLANGESLSVHVAILAVRCPSLVPPQLLPCRKSPKEIADEFVRETVREVRLSSHVDYEALVLLLEYVYLGCLHASEETAKKLKILAKRCNLQPLFQMLHRQRPKWGLPFPSFNLTSAFGLAGSCFSDIILGAKSNELVGWTCDICSDTVPHMHVHKVILQSGCDYLQGLFRSGMQESHSQVIKVDISWQALIKLVQWFYSDELPGPPSGCLWDNMDDQEKLFNLQPYVELYWLAEFWILENIQEACFNVIMSCLDSSWRLSIRIIKMAYNLSLWKLVDIAANLMAPSYRQLRDSGELEEFDDALVHLIYSASIQLN